MILREEGPAALYKGFIPKVLRLAPGGGVLLLVVEFTLEVFRKGQYLPFVYPYLILPFLQLLGLPTLEYLKLTRIRKEEWARYQLHILLSARRPFRYTQRRRHGSGI